MAAGAMTLDGAAGAFGLGALLRRASDIGHPTLPGEQVLVAKLLAMAWMATGHVARPAPLRVPWMGLLEQVPESFPWSTTLAGVALLAALGVLFTPWTRTFCLCLGGAILLDVVSSRAGFSYNRLYCAALFCMISLSGPGILGAGARWQAAVVYLGAGVDKLLSPGWRSGTVLEDFIRDLATFGRLWSPGGHVGEPNLVAGLLVQAVHRFPALPAILSWSVILCEIALAVAFLRRSPSAIALSLAFHGGVYIITGGTLGMFFHAGIISALLAVPWVERTASASAGRGGAFIADLLGTPPGLLCLCLWTCGPWLSPAFVAVLLGAGLLGTVLLGLSPRPPHGPQLDAQRVQA
jgi:hypothetical protein